jgi:glycosyltransferase involved in cell wall biosynthesis
MKLIVQIPCFNEEKTLPLVINSIPKKIKGVDKIETLIIDDGSTDKTIEVARMLGVNHIIMHKKNKGLAASFADGIDEALRVGADIIVNTDGDNQYPQKDIGKLIAPIINGEADIVVADRQTSKIAHFSKLKKGLQRMGSELVRRASGTNIPDAVSGFRAYSREAALSINIVTQFSYVTETIIQAGKKRIAITHVAVTTNPKTRESRLFKNMFQHIRKTTAAVFRSYTMYEPLKIFVVTGSAVSFIGLIPYVYFFLLTIITGDRIAGHLQSLIFGAVFIILGFMFTILGVVADLIAVNRKLSEDSLYRLKKLEYQIIPAIKIQTRRKKTAKARKRIGNHQPDDVYAPRVVFR